MNEAESVLDPEALTRLHRIGGDTLVRKMIELFLLHGQDRIALAMNGLETADMKQIEHATHSLKSSAGNLGAVRLQHAATDIELITQDGNVPGPADDLAGRISILRREYDLAAAELTSRLAELTS